jgi:hypothetical protein
MPKFPDPAVVEGQALVRIIEGLNALMKSLDGDDVLYWVCRMARPFFVRRLRRMVTLLPAAVADEILASEKKGRDVFSKN